MDKKLVFMFSGQGSQYYNMGKELFEVDQRFKLWLSHCSEIASDYLGCSLLDVIYQDVDHFQVFDRVLYSNPALISIEYALARILMEQGYQPDYLLGYSLGEITAAVVSGAITLEDALKFSIQYAQLLESSTEPAKMLSVLAAQSTYREHASIFENCWLTGKNFSSNFVVSGRPNDIKQVQTALGQLEVVAQILPVNQGFHTPIVDTIEREFLALAAKLNYHEPEVQCISSCSCQEVSEYNEHVFWDITRRPVEFQKTVDHLLSRGEYVFLDVGPSGTLATFIKYILPQAYTKSAYYPLMNQFGRSLTLLNTVKLNLSA